MRNGIQRKRLVNIGMVVAMLVSGERNEHLQTAGTIRILSEAGLVAFGPLTGLRCWWPGIPSPTILTNNETRAGQYLHLSEYATRPHTDPLVPYAHIPHLSQRGVRPLESGQTETLRPTVPPAALPARSVSLCRCVSV